MAEDAELAGLELGKFFKTGTVRYGHKEIPLGDKYKNSDSDCIRHHQSPSMCS